MIRRFHARSLVLFSFAVWFCIQVPAKSEEGKTHTRYEQILPLKPEEGVFAYSRISPDGNYLSYASETLDGKILKRTVNFIDLKNHKILFSEPGMDSYWSPDGNRVIYLSNLSGENDNVSIWHRETGVVTRNVAPAKLGHYFTWATVGGRDLILTQMNRYFWLKNERALRPYRTVRKYPIIGTGEEPMISRDGKLIATFVNGAVAVRGLDEDGPLLETHLKGGKADFSWDGRYIAFQTFKANGRVKGYDIVVVDLQEKKKIQVTDLPGSCHYPSWTRDGRLSFRYDSEDYRGFMMASNFLKNPSEPLPTSHGPPEAGAPLMELYGSVNPPRQKVVLVNVWAGWCVHSRDEVPTMNRVRLLLREKNLDAEIVGACEPSSLQSDRDRILRGNGISLPQVDIEPKELASFSVQMIPTSLLFVDGKLAERRYGAQSYEEIIKWLNKQGVPLKKREKATDKHG